MHKIFAEFADLIGELLARRWITTLERREKDRTGKRVKTASPRDGRATKRANR